MKIIRYALIFLGFLIVGVLVAFLLSPKQVSYENKVEINVPVDQVWGAFTNQELVKSWIPNLKHIEHVSGEPMTKGAVSKMVFEENGQEMELYETVQEITKNERYTFNLKAEKLMEIDTDISFTSDGSSTSLISQTTVKPLIWILRFTLFGAEETMQARSQEGYVKLKELAEAAAELNSPN